MGQRVRVGRLWRRLQRKLPRTGLAARSGRLSAVGCGTGSESKRAANDVAADADPDTGVAVYDSVPYLEPGEWPRDGSAPGWIPIGGTSVASPIVASMFALAGGSHGVAYPAKTLYSHLGSGLLHDIAEGGNGDCEGFYGDGCTGSMIPLSLEIAARAR